MKKINQNSKEFRRVIKNLELEDLHMSPDMKKKTIEVINSGKVITSTLLKEILVYDKV